MVEKNPFDAVVECLSVYVDRYEYGSCVSLNNMIKYAEEQLGENPTKEECDTYIKVLFS